MKIGFIDHCEHCHLFHRESEECWSSDAMLFQIKGYIKDLHVPKDVSNFFLDQNMHIPAYFCPRKSPEDFGLTENQCYSWSKSYNELITVCEKYNLENKD